jgi:hypothetical protein
MEYPPVNWNLFFNLQRYSTRAADAEGNGDRLVHLAFPVIVSASLFSPGFSWWCNTTKAMVQG